MDDICYSSHHLYWTWIILPVLSALLSNNTPSNEQGEMFGVNSSLLGLMAALGPLFAGLVYDLIVPNATFWNWCNTVIIIISHYRTIKNH